MKFYQVLFLLLAVLSSTVSAFAEQPISPSQKDAVKESVTKTEAEVAGQDIDDVVLNLEFVDKYGGPYIHDGSSWDLIQLKWTITNNSNQTIWVPVAWTLGQFPEGPYDLLPYAYLAPPDTLVLLSGEISWEPDILVEAWPKLYYQSISPKSGISGNITLDSPLRYPRFLFPNSRLPDMSPSFMPRSVYECRSIKNEQGNEVAIEKEQVISKTTRVYMAMEFYIVEPQSRESALVYQHSPPIEYTRQQAEIEPSRVKITKALLRQTKLTDIDELSWSPLCQLAISNVLHIEIPLPEPITLYYDPAILKQQEEKNNSKPLHWKP